MHKIIFVMGYLLLSCNHSSIPDFEKAKREILLLEEKQRDWHFRKNATAFVDKFSGDFLSINKGVIDKPSRENSYEKFDAYFKGVQFVKWDNNKEPVIRFSNDASVAYVAVDKIVIVKIQDKDGIEKMDTTNFAWLTVYKKDKNEWKIDCVTSTNK